MSGKPLTAQQAMAVACRDSSLIVSAAAGSGKTFVLARRVSGLLTDPVDPCDIDRLLVVTFTSAAASEMRQRIGGALKERLFQTPNNTHLRRQLALLGSSRIQTVHGFCQRLIREHFSRCGVDPDFRLMDEAQCTLLQQAALETVIERAYETGGDFSRLCDLVCGDRSDRDLCDAVLDIYRKMRSHPHPEQLLDLLPGLCAAGIDGSASGREMLREARELAEYARSVALSLREQAASAAEVEQSYGPALEDDLRFSEALLKTIDQGWESAEQCVSSHSKKSLKAVRNYEDKAFLDRIKSLRDKLFYKIIDRLRQDYFSLSPEEIAAEREQQVPAVRALCRLIADFTAEYDGQKRRLGILDFSDLEHFALRLLVNGDGTPTDIAQELREQFREIIVDEYQDTNEIQEEIFRALRRKGDSAFFVGDVKQSIYRFRLSDPGIFLERCRVSLPYDGKNGGDRRLALNCNFRSRPEVLELCNYVFSRLMTRRLGEVDYDAEQRLNPHRGQEGYAIPSEILLLDCAGGEGDGETSDGCAEAEEAAESRIRQEARLTALRIERLLREERVPTDDGGVRPARPEDVAILLSSFQDKAKFFRQALLERGIPCGGGDAAFFGTVEVSSVLSLLRLLQNRRQDIPLVAVLRSPFYLFSADDLTRLRLQKRDCDLIECVVAAAEAGDARSAAVIADLDRWDQAALEMPLSRLVRMIYDETGADGLFAALDNGRARVHNLRRIEALARGFDGSVTGGLSAFLRWIDQLLAEGKDLEERSGDSGGVQLMTIHGSKGLEFPFVILADLSKPFNEEDQRKKILFHQHMGVGLKCRQRETNAVYRSWQYNAIRLRIRGESRSEELRKLYVAMTRAREKLILILADKNLGNAAARIADETGGAPSSVWLSMQTSFTKWLLAALLTHPAAGELRQLCGTNLPVGDDGTGEHLLVRLISPEALFTEAATEQTADAASEETKKDALFDFAAELAKSREVYAHLAATRLPSKLTPTGLRRLIPEAGEIFGHPEKPAVREYRELAIRRADPEAAKRGTVMHTLLRYVDLNDCADIEAVKRQAAALTESGRLTAEEKILVAPEAIVAFAASPLARRVREAKRVLREYEFGVLLDTADLLQNGPAGEAILLNGAIDLLLFEKGGLTVVDFKTDRVAPGNEKEKAEEHRLQLELYARAAEQVFGLPVQEKWVWFLRQGMGVSL
ncbi:MAG: helicase-exonuclease AddAB subunit AddA [Clostridia bacterium]|nr:helicase-exonuclease AddAB subunit AddA [Clostridia bacterium]